jgi:hypothetical protein
VAFEHIFLPDITPKSDTDEETGETEEEKSEEAQAEEGAEAKVEEEEEEELDPNLPKATDSKGVEVNIYLPMITWNALSIRERDRGLRDYLNSLYKDGTPVGGFLKPQFARSVKEALLKVFDVKFFYSGKLKPGVLLSIEGKELLLEDVYAVVKNRIGHEEKMMALKEILLCKSMDRALKEAGCLLNEKEAEAAYRAQEKEYEGTIFPLEFAIRLHGYFNPARYKNLYSRRAGFEKMIADELNNDEVLKDFYQGAARLFYENGSCKLQMIFFGIYDHEKDEMRENGYEWAHAQMAKVLERLKAGEDFETLAKEYEDKEGTFNTSDFELLNRQLLRTSLGETSKSNLITGFSLADYCFYRGKTDEIVGPVTKYWGDMGLPSHKGVFLVRIAEFRRSQVLKPFDISKKMVTIDYADLRYSHWAEGTLKGSKIELTLN